MKKSCSAKESKVATTKDADNVVNTCKKDPKENLTEEQLLINRKLLESGIVDEGLGWLEKTNIFKTINVSLDTAGSERVPRSSPRLTKTANSKGGKWVENSFENSKEDIPQNEKIPKTKSSKKDSELTPSGKSSPSLIVKKQNQEPEGVTPKSSKSSHKIEAEKLQKDAETNNDSPKSSKKVHYIKVHVEENSKEECSSSVEGEGQRPNIGKKRASQLEIDTVEAPKKLKMDEANNGVSSEEETSLELEIESKKRSAPFQVRDIKTIVSECEIRNKKWKETFSKCKCPTRWGVPIVKNCSEKWDGKQIPAKLLHRYQKYLSSNNLTHPIFLPVKSECSVDFDGVDSETNSQLSTGVNSDCRNESENNLKNFSEGSFSESSKIGLENNLDLSSSPKDTSGRMVLRNRSQQKTIISDEEEFSSDDSDDWLVKQKSTKKQKVNTKNKKASEQINKQLVLKLEKCNINRGNGGDGRKKNGNKSSSGYSGDSMMSSNTSQVGGNSNAGPDPDTMVCPICSHRFKKQLIESHATECASKTYKD